MLETSIHQISPASTTEPASTPVLESEIQTEPIPAALTATEISEVETTNSEPNAASEPEPTHKLNDKHLEECTVKRGLSREWIEANVRSVNADEASEHLGYEAKCDCMLLKGYNDFVQLKPDVPWESEEEDEKGKKKKKKPKYRTPSKKKAKHDAMLPNHPDNKQYWTDYETLKSLAWKIKGRPYLLITEGFFKAVMACSRNMPCIALAGVEMGLTSSVDDPEGKRFLVKTLKLLVKEGFGFIIIFDADSATNKNVNIAQYKLAKQLAKFKVPVYLSPGWEAELGKGMDDYIQANGAEQFKREVMGKIVDLSAWEQQFKKEETDKKSPPKDTARNLAEKYRNEWKYDLEQQTWRRYNGKVWEAIADKVFKQGVYLELITWSIDFKHSAFVENVIYFLELELLQKEWQSFERHKWIAFFDYVLEVETGKKHEHSPGFGFTSHLSHNCPTLAWEKGGDVLELLRLHAPNFYAYAMYAQNGNPNKVLKMLAFMNGTLTYRFSDLQMFMLLLGAPGAGKGSFVRLLETAVGKGNFTSAKLHRLGEDTVIASIIDKQLVICPDEKKQNSDISGLLSLTGGDSIPYRQIYKPASSSKFHGSLVIVANNNPFIGDTTGIDRRLSLIQFDNPIPARDSGMEQKMQAEVGILIALALAMDERQVKNLITGIEDGYIPDIKRLTWLHKTENDSIALFVEEMLIPAAANEYVLLGGKGDNPNTLYGAYMQMCEDNNSKSLFTKNNFRAHLMEICREVGWQVREARHGTGGWKVYGIKLRGDNDPSPRISDFLGSTNIKCRQCSPSVDPSVDLKAAQSKESAESVGFSSSIENTQDDQQQVEVESQQPPTQEEGNQQPGIEKKSEIKVEAQKAYTPALPAPDKDLRSTLGSTPAYTKGGEPTLATSTSAQNNGAGQGAKNTQTISGADVEPTKTVKSERININSKVVIIDKRYPDEIYIVVAGNGRPCWTVQRADLVNNKKQSKSDLIDINANQLIKLE